MQKVSVTRCAHRIRTSHKSRRPFRAAGSPGARRTFPSTTPEPTLGKCRERCRFVIVGHSERRGLYGEDDGRVAAKFLAARRAGLTPILCVGETLEQRDRGETENVVGRQLDAVLAAAGVAALADAVLAYEPVWAIGTGRNATPQQAQDVHAFIRGRIGAKDRALAGNVAILYGGSVKPDNAPGLLAMPDVDGGLIGGASLLAADFIAICAAARR